MSLSRIKIIGASLGKTTLEKDKNYRIVKDTWKRENLDNRCKKLQLSIISPILLARLLNFKYYREFQIYIKITNTGFFPQACFNITFQQVTGMITQYLFGGSSSDNDGPAHA